MPTENVNTSRVLKPAALLKSLSTQKLSAEDLSGLEADLTYKPGEPLAQTVQTQLNAMYAGIWAPTSTR
jgi:hypothetical protein